ncbi:MAG: hypothetical protein ACK6DV_33060, partial [Deltaproteobacteria bacterium]
GPGLGHGPGHGHGLGLGHGQGQGAGGPGSGGGHDPTTGQTRDLSGDGTLARVRPRLLPGSPSQQTHEWIDPRTGEPGPAGLATGPGASGQQGAIERAPIPEDYREHVRTYFGGGGAAVPGAPTGTQERNEIP